MKKTVFALVAVLISLTARAQWSADLQLRSLVGWGDSKEIGLRFDSHFGLFGSARAAQTVDYGFMNDRESTTALLLTAGYAFHLQKFEAGVQMDARFYDVNSIYSNNALPWWTPQVYAGYSFKHWQLQLSSGWPYAVGIGGRIPLKF